jgi:hypothetical protein
MPSEATLRDKVLGCFSHFKIVVGNFLPAIKGIGVDLTSNDLADYWLDHVRYNFDEYGLTMANFRLGLRPPMAGFYNNYFEDCMGCPIRTEIWACLAAGRPRIVARYAIFDSIIDHTEVKAVILPAPIRYTPKFRRETTTSSFAKYYGLLTIK